MKFDISSVSRSAVTTAANITANPFAVFGDMIPSEIADNHSARTIIYHNTPVTYNEAKAAWTTPAPQYWYPKHDHSFVGVHPASALSAADANIQYSNSQLSFTYTLPTDHTKVTDILSATQRRRFGSGTTEAVVYLRFENVI